MFILSSLFESVWQVFFNIKKTLVGDLTIQDIIRLARERQLPEHLTQTLRYAEEEKITSFPDGSYGFIANYGLLGQALDMNTAVVIGNPERSQALKELVNTTDNLPHGRAPYRIGNRITGGVPVLASRSGKHGLDGHKYLAQVLPSMEFVLETAVSFTHEAFERHIIENEREYQNDLKFEHEELKRLAEEFNLDENSQKIQLDRRKEAIKKAYELMRYDVKLDDLVRRIMAYVLVGFELKEDHHTLISRMERQEQDLTHDYQTFVAEAIQNQKINPSTQCALWKALYQRHAKPADPLIHDLFTVLVTNANVATVVFGGRQNTVLLTAFIKEIKATPQDTEKRKTLRYDALKQMFESSLYHNEFQPASLPRYLEKPIEWEGQTIPGGTNLFIQHRSLETKTKHSAFSVGFRSCPGQRLTEYIFRGIITTLVEIQYINPLKTHDETHTIYEKDLIDLRRI